MNERTLLDEIELKAAKVVYKSFHKWMKSHGGGSYCFIDWEKENPSNKEFCVFLAKDFLENGYS